MTLVQRQTTNYNLQPLLQFKSKRIFNIQYSILGSTFYILYMHSVFVLVAG